MNSLKGILRDVLTNAVAGRGIAAASVIPTTGAAACTFWIEPHAGAAEPLFLAYSITKTMIATLVLELCDEHKLGLDDPLSGWFPDIPSARTITLRRLLNHTAGIPDYGGNPIYHEDIRASPLTPWSFERFAAETFEKGLLFEPGTGWRYSNPGYMLLKRILEMTTSSTFRDLVAERIAQPAGLMRTVVAESMNDMKRLARGMSTELSSDHSPVDVRTHYHPAWVSHGVVAATSSDIVRFYDALFAGRLVTPPSLARMTEPLAVSVDEDSASIGRAILQGAPAYGLGLMVNYRTRWGRLMGHSGGGPCYSASAFHAADLNGATVCVMGAIEDGFHAESIIEEILDRLGRTA